MVNILNSYLIEENKAGLYIYREFLDTFKRCEAHAEPYLNVVAIFFHDIMRIVCGYELKKRELAGPFKPHDIVVKSRPRTFPYFNYQDILNGIDIEGKDYNPTYQGVSSKWRIYSHATKYFFKVIPGQMSVRFKSISVELSPVLKKLLKNRVQVGWLQDRPIFIPALDAQLRELFLSINKVCNELKLSCNPEDMFKVLENHIRAFYFDHPDSNKMEDDLIVLGTLTKLVHRIHAAKARSQGIPVISLSHGEQDGALDEPIFGYGERTFPNMVISYGEEASRVSELSSYLKGLYDNPEYVLADSSLVRKNYKGNYVERLESIEGKRLLYVPTTFTGFSRCSPFLFLPDALYLKWQKFLFEQFPGLIFKAHPKRDNKPITDIYKSPTSRIIFEPFHQCLNMADVFIFDYISTASSIAAATEKPIIYFNIGVRNFATLAKSKWEKRCIWIDVDPANPGNLKKKIEEQSGKECINEYSESFSITKNGDRIRREDILVNTILELSGKRSRN